MWAKIGLNSQWNKEEIILPFMRKFTKSFQIKAWENCTGRYLELAYNRMVLAYYYRTSVHQHYAISQLSVFLICTSWSSPLFLLVELSSHLLLCFLTSPWPSLQPFTFLSLSSPPKTRVSVITCPCLFHSGEKPSQEHWGFQPDYQHSERAMGGRQRPGPGLPGGLRSCEWCQAFWICEFHFTESLEFIDCTQTRQV